MSQKALNPHAPALNITKRLLGPFHFTGIIWYRLPYWAFTHLPLWIEGTCILFFTTFFFVTLGRIRAAIASNLEPVLGPTNLLQRWIRAYRTMFAFASGMTERYRFLVEPQRFRLSVEGLETWRQVMEPGGGVILVSAHIGFWEISPQFGTAQEKRRIHVVREKEIDPRAQEFMREVLARSDDKVVFHYAGGEPGLPLELADALRNGEIVALQGDRPRVDGRIVSATIFGRPIPLPVGPAALARAADVPLLPTFNFRKGRYQSHIVVRNPIRVCRTANREADVADAIHRLAKEIEWAISQEPHQWFCFRKLW